ncbi:retrovirus-related pol polyprotein from transposon TNT 1-94 [Tanacetum coccineum]
MTTLADKAILSGADKAILSGADNRPPMLEKDIVTRPNKYSKLSATEAIQADYDIKATNIILQGLPPEIYALVSNHKVAKELWERIQLLMQGTSLTMIWRLYLLHIDLCRPMRVASVNEKKSKDEAPDFIIKFLKMIQVRLKVPVRRIRTDNGTEFVNQTLLEYYEMVGISHETSVARSPQQNCVVERRNRTLIEAARTMLIYAKAPLFLWAKAVATACYTQNCSIIRLRYGKMPYVLLHDKLPDLLFFHVYGALCYLTNDSENLGKLQSKADIDFDELTSMASKHSSSGPALHEMTPATISSGLMPNPPLSTPVDCPALEVIAPIAEVVAPVPAALTGSPSSTTVDQDAPSPNVAHMNNNPFFGISIPENDFEASSSLDVIPTVVQSAAPYSEHVTKWTKDHPLDNIIGELEIPELIPRPDKVMVITLKWIYKVKLDELGGILNNKARLVARGYRQEEGIDFEESFSPEFSKGTVDPTLFIRRQGKDILLVQIYVDDIIFASTTPDLCDQFSKLMCLKFKMSTMGKISFFLGLQISQSPRGIFINQSKYALESLRKYGIESSDLVDTPMVEKSKLDEDTQVKAVDPTHYHGMIGTLMYLTATYAYADHAGCQDTRRSTSEFLWMRSQLTDYGIGFNKIPMYCDNKSAIALCCNNVQHSRSKHIDIRFHFIKEQVENGVVELYFVNTEYQLADIFTKALGREIIEFLINKLGMRSFSPNTLKQLADEVEE